MSSQPGKRLVHADAVRKDLVRQSVEFQPELENPLSLGGSSHVSAARWLVCLCLECDLEASTSKPECFLGTCLPFSRLSWGGFLVRWFFWFVAVGSTVFSVTGNGKVKIERYFLLLERQLKSVWSEKAVCAPDSDVKTLPHDVMLGTHGNLLVLPFFLKSNKAKPWAFPHP